MGENSFPKEYRLTKPYEYKRVYQNGKKVSSSNFLLFHLPNSLGHSRIGLSVGRKVGKAVRRNLVKRRMREIMRQLRPLIKSSVDVVLVAHTRSSSLSYRQMELEITRITEKTNLL